MNLALFLERAGRDDPRRPALGFGARVLRGYGDMAGRVARLAGALRSLGLNPGDRVAILGKNSPDYVEVLYAIWHAGLAAVPANAKLHGAELGYILEQSSAQMCFTSDGLDGELAPYAPKSLKRLTPPSGKILKRTWVTGPISASSLKRWRVCACSFVSGKSSRHSIASTSPVSETPPSREQLSG